MSNSPLIFAPWVDKLARLIVALLLGGVFYVVFILLYATSPKATASGYQPEQPVPYSHKLHAGELGIDCRYCHIGVDKGAKATIPATQTCMNCHANVLKDSPKLEALRQSYSTGKPVEWIRVHDLADFVYFDHSAHVNRGVGCATCHGRIDLMEVVYQDQPLNMGWCLECHRNPERYLRPLDRITDMTWKADDQLTLGADIRKQYNINPSTDCSTCHR